MKKIWLAFGSYPVTTAVYLERALRKKYSVSTVGPMLPQEFIEKWGLQNLKQPIVPQDISVEKNIDIAQLYFRTEKSKQPDYFIWIESIPGYFPRNIKNLPIPTVCYLIDSHLHIEEHILIAENFDQVFIAQRKYVNYFKKNGIPNVHWLPLGCDPDIHKNLSQIKTKDISFVGSITGHKRRKELLKKLGAKFSLYIERSFLLEMSKIFSESKIVFNNAVRDDLNMRVFEIMSTGSLLLTDLAKESGQTEMFVDGEDIAVYNDETIENVAAFYLENDELRETIARRGRELVLNAHKYEDRAVEIMNILSGKSKDTSSAEKLRKKSLKNISITNKEINKLKRSFVIPVIDYSPASKFNIKTLLDDLEKIGGEVIVVFNSEEVASEMKNDPRIDHYAVMKNNIGVPRAWNVGLDIARTPITFIINSDVHIEKTTVEILEKSLISLSNAAVVGPQGSFFHFEMAEDIKYFDKGTFENIIEVDAVSGFLFAVKTKYFHDGTLKFENKFTPCYFEEWDLGLQIKRAGLKNYIVPTTGYEHHWSGSINSMKAIKYYDKKESAQEILNRNKNILLDKWKKSAADNKHLLLSKWVDLLLEKSKVFIEHNDFETAKTIYEKILEFYPNLVAPYLNLGIINFLNEIYDEAEKLFLKVIEIEPDNKTALAYLEQINNNKK